MPHAYVRFLLSWMGHPLMPVGDGDLYKGWSFHQRTGALQAFLFIAMSAV